MRQLLEPRRNIIKPFKKKALYNISDVYIPGLITGLLADWYPIPSQIGPTDSGKGSISDGGTIGYLDDFSNNLNIMKQSSSGARPIWNRNDSDFNGQPSLAFDGTADYLLTDVNVPAIVAGGLAGDDTQISVICVYKRTISDPGSTRVWFSAAGSAGDQRNWILNDQSTDAARFQKFDFVATPRAEATSVLDTNPVIQMWSMPTGITAEYRRDGGVDIATDNTVDSLAMTGVDRLGIGARVVTTVNLFNNAKIVRILLYSGDIVSDSYIDILHNYLGNLYGITVTAVT